MRNTLLMQNDFYDLSEYSNLKYGAWIHILAAVVGFITSFVNAHIWSPASTYYMVLVLVLFDFGTGVLVGIRSARGFETRKAKKILLTLCAYTACMFFAHNFAKHEPGLFWMPQTVLAPIVVINFLSFAKNCSLLGWLPEKVSQVLYKNIDRYKNPEPLINPTNETLPIPAESESAAVPA